MPTTPPPNSLWSVVTPIKPAKLSLSSQAADLRTYCQQIWLGEGLHGDNRCPSPSSLIWNQSHRLSHSVSPTLPMLLSSDTGLGPAPNRVFMLKSSVLLSERVPPWTHCPSRSIHVRVELLLKEHHVMSPQRSWVNKPHSQPLLLWDTFKTYLNCLLVVLNLVFDLRLKTKRKILGGGGGGLCSQISQAEVMLKGPSYLFFFLPQKHLRL